MSRPLKVIVEQKYSAGPEELYKYITRNSEYVIRGDRCCALLEQQTQGESTRLNTVERRIIASVRWLREGGYRLRLGDLPEVGDSLLMGEPGHEVLTSAIQRIELAAQQPT